MTLIVGIVCRDGIVVAADSQTTYGKSKACDSEKISVVKFQDLSPILVAQSGAVDISARVLDKVERSARSRIVSDEDSVIAVVQDAMRFVRAELRRQHGDCSSEQLQRVLENTGLDCELMAAFYINSKPCLYTFRFQQGISTPTRKYYNAIGGGADLANYIVTDLSFPESALSVGITLAVYAVDRVTKHIPECDGPIRAAWIKPVPEWLREAARTPRFNGAPWEVPHRCYVLPQEAIDQTIKFISAQNERMKRRRVRQIQVSSERAMEGFLIAYTAFPKVESGKKSVTSPLLRSSGKLS